MPRYHRRFRKRIFCLGSGREDEEEEEEEDVGVCNIEGVVADAGPTTPVRPSGGSANARR